MNTPTSTPGALALAYIKRDAAAWTPEYRDAVKDMRALLAERDAAVQHAERLAAIITEALHHDEALRDKWKLPPRLHADMAAALAAYRQVKP